jgi:ATP-dependent Lon protease
MNEDRIPLIALRDDVALPGENRSIMIGRKSTVEAARSAWEGSRQLALFAQRDSALQTISHQQDLCGVGCLCDLQHFQLSPDGTGKISLRCTRRIRITKFEQLADYALVSVCPLEDHKGASLEESHKASLAAHLADLNDKRTYCELLQKARSFLDSAKSYVPAKTTMLQEEFNDDMRFVMTLAKNLRYEASAKQSILEASSMSEIVSRLEIDLGELSEQVDAELSILKKAFGITNGSN